MRTTVTLDDDTAAVVKRLMRERDLSFKQAVNDLIRAGAAPNRPAQPVKLSASDMGEPLVDLTYALRIAGQLEDAELTRKLAERR